MKIRHEVGDSPDHQGAIPVGKWWAIAKRTYRQASDDNLGLIAAGVAFYGFLALVPVLGALVLTVGLVFDPMVIVRQFAAVAPSLPTEVATLIAEQLDSLIATSSTKKGLGLLLSLGLALFGAMKGAGAVIIALNIAYDVENKRGFIAGNRANLLITIGAILLCITLIFATVVSQAVGTILGTASYMAELLVKIAGWALAAAITIAGLAALYRYGPSRENARWRWLTPGSICATIGLLAASSAFGWYASNFGNYNATYGSLGAVVVLLMWLYFSAYVLLLGAELNAEIEYQAAGNPATGAAHAPGKRKAVRAHDVAD
jgi:membrane protein